MGLWLRPSRPVPGTYTLTYTKNNCTATTTLVITQPPVITPINSSYCYVANSNAAINLTSLYTSTPASGTFSVANASGATVYTGTGTSFIPPQLGTFGNYTVTYTAGTPPCPATVNLTINQLPVLTNPTISACQANAINLGTLMQPQPTGGVFGPSNYVTTNSSGSFLQVPTTAGGNFPITYTYTNPNGQTCTVGGSVYVSPVVTITGNNNITLCSPGANTPIDLNTLIQPVTTPATSGGYFTGPGITGSSIFTPTGIGSYQVTYVVIDAIGCEFREVFTFQINDCCYYGSATQYIPMGNNGQTTTLSSLIGTGALPPSPATVQRTFSGKLLVDVPYVFSGSHIILCPGAEIEVNPNIKVTLNNSTILEGNTAMWKGIKNFGALTIKGATIRDAEFAVNEQIGGTTSITNSLFDRNFIGILGNPNAIFGQFWGNTFDCVGCSGTSATTMLAAYNGQSNWATFSRAGIQLNNSNITIGALGTGIPLGTLNYFRNSKYGIESYNSQATVLNSNITHANWIAAPSSIVSPPAAAGIYGYNSSISVTGMGTTPSDPNAFHNCHYGIFAANGQYTRVQDCKMEYTNTLYPMRIGIHTQNTPLTNISIDRNLIHATNIGINSLYDENVSHLRINSNTINMNQASATQLANAGIQITELGATGKCVIYQNTINLNQCYTGVRLNTRTIVNKNIININSNIIPPVGQPVQRPRGIWLIGGNRQNIACNEINYTPATANDAYAIDLRAAIYSRYMNNHTNSTREGLHIEDQCYQLALRSNWFNGHGIGLHLGATTYIGHQLYMGNLWWSPTTNTQAKHDGSAAVYSQSLFKVSPSPIGFTLPTGFITAPSITNNANNVIPGSGWFGYGVEQDSSIVIDCPHPQFDFSYRLKMDSVAAQGEIPTDAYTEAINWTTDALLYERLQETDNADWRNSFFEDFYKKTEKSTIGQLQKIREATRKAFSANSANEEIQDYTYQIEALTEELANLSNRNQEDAQLMDKSLAIHAEIQHYQKLLAPIKDNVARNHANVIDLIRSQNTDITSHKVYELNEKVVNDVYFATVAKGILQLDNMQISQIEGIANQCPSEGGRAVYQARSLYQLVNPNKMWSDEILCKETASRSESIMQMNQKRDALSTNFALIPNPAKDKVRLKSLDNPTWDGTIEILSNIGQIMSSTSVEQAAMEQTVDISSLAPGMYYCRVVNKEGNILFVGKLFVAD